ncbi:MAG: hypothetical protein U9O97_01295 [Elusimicrobiota bacterium]|nr:hypothetical protein [Elusimicrobiota bacterium]
MKDLNGKINEIAGKEKELLKKKEDLKKKIGKLFKDYSVQGEKIMTDAVRRSSEEKEKMLNESGKQADEEVSRMIAAAEIEAKKAAVVFRKNREKIIMELFGKLKGYLKN